MHGGIECNLTESATFQSRKCKEAYSEEIRECRKSDELSYWAQWGEWENCQGSCGQPGFRKRVRECNLGTKKSKCEGGEAEQKEKCVTFCPSGTKSTLSRSDTTKSRLSHFKSFQVFLSVYFQYFYVLYSGGQLTSCGRLFAK